MCGIIGYIGNNALNNLIKGLEEMEYRGYDSSGIGLFLKDNIEIVKSVGSVSKLKEKLKSNKYNESKIGIAHTRWATHGNILNKNAHPFESNNLILAHNGIIENYQELKDFLINKGYEFKSDVDSEVIVHIIDYYYKNNNYIEAINKGINRLKGSYAIIILFKDNPNTIYGAKKDSPLFVSKNNDKLILASDLVATIDVSNKYYKLLDNDIVECNLKNIKVYNNLKQLDFKYESCNLNKESISKQGYSHYMLKEIYQEPEIFNSLKKISIDYLNKAIEDFDEIVIVGCGSAMHAGLIGKYLFEELLGIKTHVEIASEFRYSPFIYSNKALFIFISQSGETADTIASLKLVKEKNIKTLGIVNVIGSTIANECDYLLALGIGNEIAVASTKAYYAQIIYLYKLCFLIAKKRKIKLGNLEKEFLKFDLKLGLENTKLKQISKIISKKKQVFFIGRNIDYYLTLEGALKLKEITYINCQAYPAGELKHGPISLINKKSLTIAIMSKSSLKEKTKSNIEEIISRKGKVILISDETINKKNLINIKVDSLNNEFLMPLTIIPILQLIAYYTALYRKTNIDKPKNLAKSVTVE